MESRATKRVKNAELIAVLEARWEARGNYGIGPLFELISAVSTYNPHAHRYDMFSGAESFRSVLAQVGRLKRFEAIYVASHGNKSGLDNGPALGEIIDALRDANDDRHIHGAYFSVCSFGQSANVNEILNPLSRTNLQWIVTYERDTDWLESAAADLLFWSGYLDSQTLPLKRALRGARRVHNLMPGAERSLGWRASKWSRAHKQASPLLAELDD